MQILTNQYETWPQYICSKKATICMPIRSWMSSLMGQIEPEHPELFVLEFGKIAEYDFVYTLSSTKLMLTNQHQTWSKCM